MLADEHIKYNGTEFVLKYSYKPKHHNRCQINRIQLENYINTLLVNI